MADLIDRQKIKARFEPWLKVKGYSEGELNIIRAVLYEITIMPSAQPESKKGKWIEAYDPFNRISGRCSVCGWEAHLYEDDVVGMNYCPNCGADMRGEQDG